MANPVHDAPTSKNSLSEKINNYGMSDLLSLYLTEKENWREEEKRKEEERKEREKIEQEAKRQRAEKLGLDLFILEGQRTSLENEIEYREGDIPSPSSGMTDYLVAMRVIERAYERLRSVNTRLESTKKSKLPTQVKLHFKQRWVE